MSSISQTRKSPRPTPSATQYFPGLPRRPSITLPNYVRPLPQRILAEDIEYLGKKGALTVPDVRLRNELLRSYAQYVHPFMPVLDLGEFLTPIEKNDGANPISLFLLQAVMFAGTAFIDMRFLQTQGHESRKAARKYFFQKARLLYDFDYESDRISLVQALLLMTYWYETPDDQKDTWHWMGVSLSLAHTIGLHRNPDNSQMDVKRQRLWKRCWWACFTRDRLIALGMRRPTRIRNEDFDVPMLVPEDFDTEPLPPELVRMLGGCPAVRDANKRSTLALLCIELAKLCLCISQVLASQYSVLSHKLGSTTQTTMMLVPKKSAAQVDEVMKCEHELERWCDQLSPTLQYFIPGTNERSHSNDGEVINVHRALLHMVYSTTSSALHRPQVLPSVPQVAVAADLQALSRRKVRDAATEITEIARDLYLQDQVRYLPTSGVTVLLPAIIIHLLDIKSSDPNIRNSSLRRFYQCMQVLQRLREMYASADSAFAFLEAAIRKANLDMSSSTPVAKPTQAHRKSSAASSDSAPARSLYDALTPPPEALHMATNLWYASTLAPEERNLFAALSPPRSDGSLQDIRTSSAAVTLSDVDNIDRDGCMLEKNDFDALINFDGGADLFAAEDGLGVDLDVDWMAGLPGSGGVDGLNFGCQATNVITGDLDTDLGMQQDT
jgi:Fungal specific transcription factor domain